MARFFVCSEKVHFSHHDHHDDGTHTIFGRHFTMCDDWCRSFGVKIKRNVEYSHFISLI